jgi:hypothetical protein
MSFDVGMPVESALTADPQNGPAPSGRPPSDADVRAVLERPEGRPWVMQDIGLLGLPLGEDRVHRLHLWDPGSCVVDAPIHDHPFDFTSRVIAGRITNTLHEESPDGVEMQRDRYMPADEDDREVDVVRLSGASTTYVAGESYRQLAAQLHASTQITGTVTLLARTFRDVPRLTVCRPAGTPWVSGRSRPATQDEVERITAAALGLMGRPGA